MPEMWSIEIYCPPMKVNSVSFGLRRAEREPCTVSVSKPSGVITFPAVIPATDINGHLLWWTVDACQLTGEALDGSILTVNLPPEPVRLKKWTMTALAIDAGLTFASVEKGIGTGSVRFPDCKTKRIGWGQYLAEAVTATGSVVFQ